MSDYQLPEGYKQTEIGVIPEDWSIDCLVNITQQHRPVSYGIVQTGRQILNGIKCVRVIDIVDGKIKDSDLITTSKEISNAYKRTVLSSGDLIIALRGKIGELAIVQEELKGANLTRGIALIALKDNYVSNFYHQYIASSNSKIRLQNSLNGSALQELPIATVRKFLIAVPPLPEQHAIAQALSDVDALIAALDKLIAKKRDLKTATMQQLLTGKKRLPGFGEGKGYKESESGVIPEDWDYIEAGKVIGFFGGNGFSSRFETNVGIRWLKIANVGVEKIKWDDETYLPARFQSEFKDYLLQPDDVVIALTRPIIGNRLKVAKLTTEDSPAFLNQRVAKLVTKGNTQSTYVYYIMQSLDFIVAMNTAMAGTDPPNIGNPALEKIFIAIPQLPEEQCGIATVLSDMDNEIAALESRLAKTQAVKQGMMQELLTGRTRLI